MHNHQNNEDHLDNNECLDHKTSHREAGRDSSRRTWFNRLTPSKAIGLSAVLITATLVATSFDFNIKPKAWLSSSETTKPSGITSASVSELADKVLPENGVELPITWGDLGKRMVETGVIDEEKFSALYAERGGIDPEISRMLKEVVGEPIRISQGNAASLLNIFWALGLGNKNDILDNGEMVDERFGGAGNFASTGGWTLSKGNAMDHYSKHAFVSLTPKQQSLVDKVSKGIYRPCCGNSTHFPDCNHGMAMLGLLELMASRGASEAEMYKIALAVNSYWFPDTYLTIAKLKASQGIEWSKVNPQEVLGSDYSSAAGFRRVRNLVSPVTSGSGGGCGV